MERAKKRKAWREAEFAVELERFLEMDGPFVAKKHQKTKRSRNPMVFYYGSVVV